MLILLDCKKAFVVLKLPLVLLLYNWLIFLRIARLLMVFNIRLSWVVFEEDMLGQVIDGIEYGCIDYTLCSGRQAKRTIG